ncbi:DNA methyltransferase [Bosea sp. PAMC 26642]|uniref:DNA methyltransferase n=1 Tax=Bosea sp. (strain PAMC 26642) TaxID=1792307 RepID=UPI00202A97E3|nr:DNA methyltransferase [Bosea sp. PAMC 26642]
MANDGSLYVHIGPQINHFVRNILDEIFTQKNCRREIIWKRVSSRSHGNYYPATHDCILFYSNSDDVIWNQLFEPLSDEYIANKYRFSDSDGRKYRKDNCLNQNRNRPNLTYEWNGNTRTWRWTKENMQILHNSGRLNLYKLRNS